MQRHLQAFTLSLMLAKAADLMHAAFQLLQHSWASTPMHRCRCSGTLWRSERESWRDGKDSRPPLAMLGRAHWPGSKLQ